MYMYVCIDIHHHCLHLYQPKDVDFEFRPLDIQLNRLELGSGLHRLCTRGFNQDFIRCACQFAVSISELFSPNGYIGFLYFRTVCYHFNELFHFCRYLFFCFWICLTLPWTLSLAPWSPGSHSPSHVPVSITLTSWSRYKKISIGS